MQNEVKNSNKTFESIGITKDYREGLAQYIWNSFEAGATEVKLNFSTKSEIGHVGSFTIEDNGSGITYETLDRNFGFLLDSTKKRSKESSAIHGGKGRGRLSFFGFATQATWITTYEKEGKALTYEVTIEGSDKNYYNTSGKPKELGKPVGTVVRFANEKLTASDLASTDLTEFLKLEFGWYLFLHLKDNFKVLINNKELDYKTVFQECESFEEVIKSKDMKESFVFQINYIQWPARISEESFFYFLNEKMDEVFRKHTSFNKTGGGAYGFFHSVYISSEYFSNFNYDLKTEKQNTVFENRNLSDKTYVELWKRMNKFLQEKRKDFYRKGADSKLEYLERENLLPIFADNKYDQQKKEDFKIVFKEIYLIEPMVFHDLKPIQEQSLLGMLALLLESDERENVLRIVDGIVNDLSKEDRAQLAKTLEKTNFNRIVRTVRMIEERLELVEALKLLVFENKGFTNERDHIQKIMESGFWLMGEQFHLTSADENFGTLLENYLAFLESSPTQSQKNTFKPVKNLSKKRPDIFMCHQHRVPNIKSNDGSLEENIILELKRPSIIIDTPQYRQIEDYFEYILSRPEFNSSLKTWKFYIIGNHISDSVKSRYDSQVHHGLKFLVHKVRNYEIYAVTWADVFSMFEDRNAYILENLKYDKGALLEHLKIKDFQPSKLLADTLIQKVKY